MNESKFQTGKFSRAMTSTSLATRSGFKHLAYLGAKNFTKDKEALKAKHEQAMGKLVFQSLAQMRGTALKASQLLSMETGLLPDGVRQQLAKGCYQVPPINRALVRKVFMQEFSQEPASLFSSFESEAFAAASLGQVHLAQNSEGKKLAVKVQYPGVSASIESDLQILHFLVQGMGQFSQTMPRKSVLNATLDEIACCLRDEVNYEKEAANTQWFKENLKVKNIRVPEVINEFSSVRILTTEYLQGLHPTEWLKTNPSMAERKQVAQSIFNLFLVSAFELLALHADPHEGNYLIRSNGELALLDFGCIRKLQPDYAKNICALLCSFVRDEKEAAYMHYRNMNMLAEEVSFSMYCEELLPVLTPLQNWLVEPFRHKNYNFADLPVPPIADHSSYGEKAHFLNDIQRDQMYFDRTLFGVYQLLKKIGVAVNTENPFIY